ncbi:MAG: glycosyltransferase family 1 protein [Synechococcus sp. cluster2_bin.209]|nr:glycosyltransferase family 1 protein [Synechococcus sp. cluster2_bin.209]
MVTTLIRFLVPGTSNRFRCGGLSVELQTARLVADLCATEVVTYRQRQLASPFLDDCLKAEKPDPSVLWIVSWGFDVPGLIRRLRGHRVAYHAHSSGYGFSLPPNVPVLAVSRNTLGYWGARAPRNSLHLLPNALDEAWLKRGARGSTELRPIDVLVQARKCSPYVLNQLVPALRSSGLIVEVQTGWVEDLVDLFNQSTVYIYDSAEYWRSRGVSEGFGLPPLEALASGCVVFSSFNHALSDYANPGLTTHQIGCSSLVFDQQRIISAVNAPQQWSADPFVIDRLLDDCSEKMLISRWKTSLTNLDALNALQMDGHPYLKTIPGWRLRLRDWLGRVATVVNRLPVWPASSKRKGA